MILVNSPSCTASAAGLFWYNCQLAASASSRSVLTLVRASTARTKVAEAEAEAEAVAQSRPAPMARNAIPKKVKRKPNRAFNKKSTHFL